MDRLSSNGKRLTRRRGTTVSLRFKQLSPTDWDCERGDVDFHIRLEQDLYAIDSFRSDVDEPDEAYITSFSCENWAAVEKYCRDFNPDTKLPEETGN